MQDGEAEVTDRRVLRGQQNREAVVEALMSLFRDGEIAPTADQIAERAGVARRSIYHHFDDLNALSAAVADRHFRELAELVKPMPTGPFDRRLKDFVGQRADLYEEAMPVYRASLLTAPHSPEVTERIEMANGFLRAGAIQTFRPELPKRPTWRLDALDAATCLDSWVRLRIAQDLPVDRARSVVKYTVESILAPSKR